MASRTEDQVVSVDGHRIKLTNLGKVLYPETGTTKGDVIDYYARIAPVLLPHAEYRPATRKRWVHGVGTDDEPGQVFFQKNLDDSTPSWVKRRPIEHKDHSNDYPLVNDLATLTWLAQIAALEIHVPQWRFGRTGTRKNPDRLVLDLDPGPGVGLLECAEVARAARDILTGMGLDPLPVTSGSKGIHLYAAIDGTQTSDEVSEVAHELARALEADLPDLVVSDMKKSLREGKVLVDWSQNNGNKTTITPYSLRGRTRPTVAAPRTWRELASKNLAQLEYTEVLARVARRGDPLAAVTVGHLESLEPTPQRMAGFDRLEKYRSMRDASKTPEPVPDAAADAPAGNSFVIQEHHARRLHYDFRLEHDGVLVSWALPKGVPTETATNHLAVQTEDHPLEYGSFEGRIPAGEYGAGEVTIWDSGDYELEKWRDGEEVIVVLHGEKHGTHRYALIHSGGGAGDSKRAENNWLIHLMKEQPAAESAPAEKSKKAEKPSAKPAPGRGTDRPPSPMLATLGDVSTIDDEDEWAFEMKWDGVRAVARVADGTVRLFSRNGVDISAGYPELDELVAATDGDAVLDGEIVALDAKGRPDFGRLQGRMHLRKPSDVGKAVRDIPVKFMVFDILERDGHSLGATEYTERREVLQQVVTAGDVVQVPPSFDGDLESAMESSLRLGLEGVMAKKRDGRYAPGARSRTWIKIKHHRAQEVVIVGWRPGHGTRAKRVGSLLMAVPEGDGLRYAGRVGTGFDERALDEMLPRLKKLARKTSAVTDVPSADARDAVWVSPRLVGEVEFAEWTPSRRLRQPTWRGWREDKSPSDVAVER
ncbi:bifunctional non-homologous end joining protein LigD [Conyzicola lurida]|uniref:DNA ligase (ATP) n=1 Tax=Conyzicola lurida TaxID=1172621 RepID=A0A841AMU7_9MICO|nr:ATP-dependent DNA ligase [Conyzicola lurida]MBB5842749.1 bifunctional non-homologous end joining protein LigD [Conyzicola lurida]